MQTEVIAKHKFSADIVNFNLKRTESQLKKTSQNKSEKKACYRTDERYFCNDRDCEWWSECQQLVAEWMR